jgi:hypothetical protein
MSDWDRKNADALADAIGKHIKSHPDLKDDNELLAIVKEAVDNAAKTVDTTPMELNRHRSLVCAICRGSHLYECDIADGWSNCCALIFQNTTAFGEL